MHIAKSSADWPAGAVWNFPNGLSGKLTLKFQVRSGFRGVNLALADHYSVPWDKEDHFYSLWNLPIDAQSRLLGTQPLTPGEWHTLEITWSVPTRAAHVSLNGKRVTTLPLRHETIGANYLRIRSTSLEPDPAGLMVESAEVTITNR